MKTRALVVAALAAAALSSGAQEVPKKVSMNFTPVSCIKAGELALLPVQLTGKGELRAYFRRVNTTDWCSVEGTNEGPLSRVVLPKFDAGDEIEYFFVVLDGRRVVTRSPRMYRSRVTEACDLPFARHVIRVALNCSPEEAAIPSAMSAGMALTDDPSEPDISPFVPDTDQ
jgi:hypothetical protein